MTRQGRFWNENASRLNEERRKLYNYRKENGLCVICGSPARVIKFSGGERTSNHCESHHEALESLRKAKKRDQEELVRKAKEAGL